MIIIRVIITITIIIIITVIIIIIITILNTYKQHCMHRKGELEHESSIDSMCFTS